MWTYLTLPFSLLTSGIGVEEVEPWAEEGAGRTMQSTSPRAGRPLTTSMIIKKLMDSFFQPGAASIPALSGSPTRASSSWRLISATSNFPTQPLEGVKSQSTRLPHDRSSLGQENGSRGQSPHVVMIAGRYGRWMSENDLSKLFVNAEPGAILIGQPREFYRSWKNQTEVTVAGRHYIREDSGPRSAASSPNR